MLDGDAGLPSAVVVFGMPFDKTDELELSRVEDELADNVVLVLAPVAVFELKSLDLGIGETVELADEARFEEAGTVLLVTRVEEPAVEVAFSTVVLVELGLLDRDDAEVVVLELLDGEVVLGEVVLEEVELGFVVA